MVSVETAIAPNKAKTAIFMTPLDGSTSRLRIEGWFMPLTTRADQGQFIGLRAQGAKRAKRAKRAQGDQGDQGDQGEEWVVLHR